MKTAFAAAWSVAATVALAAPPDLAALSDANFVDTGDALADIVSQSGLALSTMSMWNAGLDQAGPMRAAFQLKTRSGPTHRFTLPCPGGGSAIGTIRDADGSGDLSRRDTFVTEFDHCMTDGETATGRGEFTVAAHRFEGHVEITELDFRFDAMGTPSLRWTGTAHLTLRSDLHRGTEVYTVRYRDLAVQGAGRDMHWNFTLELVRPPIGDTVVALNGPLSIGPMPLRLRQDWRFVMRAQGLPRDGQLTAIDTQGARLEIEAGRRVYAYRFYQAGNGGWMPDASSQSRRQTAP
ncbi:hypothetical protein [Piscinibacter terrae]|uniref:Uncharacterized protein n=1 Tax=Piscinibacter terrae TaxID=2496871 RepID=A0A3N7HRM2_9BURK|nr:hypothetical protein [Albitalea terrae]RQP24928.1 hypothetical protein DZC73_08665 [Albitalea terrae]